MTCDGDGDAEAEPETTAWHLGLAYGLGQSDLDFGDFEVGMRRRALGASFEVHVGEGFTVGGSTGLALGGDLRDGARVWDFGLGGFGLVSGSYRVLAGVGEEPFLIVGLALGASGTPTDDGAEEATFVALDARASMTIGKMFWRALAPYGVVRLFGGPAFWRRDGEAVTGTDRHHYQLGAGMLFTSESVGAVFEVAPLGERAVTIATTVAF